MVQNDREVRYFVYLFLIGSGLLVSVGLLLASFFAFSLSAEWQAWDAVITAGLLILGAAALRARKRWLQMNQRRQAAASGQHGGAPLASIQPFPDETALTLPCIISYKRRRFRFFFFYIACTPAVFVVFIGTLDLINAIISGGTFWSLFLADVQAGWHGLVAGTLAGLVGAFVAPRDWLEVTADGLVTSSAREPEPLRLNWEDARLFAIRGGGRLLSQTERYELSSAKAVVTWKRLHPDQWWSTERPSVSFEEYERQMEALLSFIAAKTSLPLYDVR